jgi:hypothetical protein
MLIALRATPAGLLFRLRQTRFYGLSHENLFSGQATIQAPKLGGLAKFASKPAKQRASETVFQVSQLPARLPVASSVFVRCRHCLPPPSISTVLCLRRHAAVAGERATVVATPRMENRKLELASHRLWTTSVPPPSGAAQPHGIFGVETSSTPPPNGTSGSERPPRPIPPLTAKPRHRPFIVECKVVVFVHH